MDKLGIQPNSPNHLRKRISGGSDKRSKIKKEQQHIKVVYISNPLRVTLSASEFKVRVQELTGQDSDVADHILDKVPEMPATTTTGEAEYLPPKPVASTADLQMPTSTASSSGVSATFKQDGSVGCASATDFFAEMCAFPPEHCGEGELPYLCYDDIFRPYDAA